ncbi:hypothetical protein GH733_019498, partial [Mirounga leonina]
MLVFHLGSGAFDVSILNLQDDTFEVKSIAGNTHVDGENFDNCMLNAYLFCSVLKLVEESLKDAKLDKSHINEIVTVSGPACTPKFQKLLKDFLSGKELNKTISPREEVAHGGAVQAAFLMGDRSENVQELLPLGVTPSLCALKQQGGGMACLIKRDTTLPTEQTQMCSIPKIQGTFDIDSSFTHNITDADQSTSRKNKINITNGKGYLRKHDTDQIVKEVEKYRLEDEVNRDR